MTTVTPFRVGTTARQILSGTVPRLKFLGTLGAIVGLLAIAAAALIFLVTGGGPAPVGFICVQMAVFGLLYLFLGMSLGRQARAIRAMEQNPELLEGVFRTQADVWSIIGIWLALDVPLSIFMTFIMTTNG